MHTTIDWVLINIISLSKSPRFDRNTKATTTGKEKDMIKYAKRGHEYN